MKIGNIVNLIYIYHPGSEITVLIMIEICG